MHAALHMLTVHASGIAVEALAAAVNASHVGGHPAA